MISITKQFTFEAAHFIANYHGKCKNLHGHSYRLQVTITGRKNEHTAFLIDFKQLKEVVIEAVIDLMDHSLLVNEKTISAPWLNHYEGKIYYTKGEPSAENLIIDMANRIKPKLPAGIALKKLRLFETVDSWADWEM